MKFIFVLFFSIISTLSSAQLLSPEVEWFDNKSFFNDSIVKQHNIAAIHIWDSEKKDGKHFQAEKAFLHYEFNSSGKLTTSYKAIVLNRKIDSAIFQYSYNQKGKLFKLSKKQGPFHFNYYYFYKNDSLASELKLNVVNNSNDTAYLHYFEHQNYNNSKRLIVKNSIHKPFMFLDSQYDDKEKLIRFRKSYYRNQNFTEVKYLYENNQIKEVSTTPFGSGENKKVSYTYKNKELHLVEHYIGKKLVRKYAFTYNHKNLPKAIIERDLENKTIKIYRLEYLYLED